MLALRPVPLPGGAPYRRRYVFSSPTIDLRSPLRHPSPSHPSSTNKPGGGQTMAVVVRPDPRPPQLLARQEKRRWQPLLPFSYDRSSSAPTPSSLGGDAGEPEMRFFSPNKLWDKEDNKFLPLVQRREQNTQSGEVLGHQLVHHEACNFSKIMHAPYNLGIKVLQISVIIDPRDAVFTVRIN